jgi:flavin reductase (DIM6/NTAB) family NADH-FMN oxidoreductase RutF
MDPSDPSIEPAAVRAALGRFTTGVTIITCRDAQGERVGLTANSFNSLSLDPPLVLWSLRETSASLGAFRAATHFVVNVLSESQVDLSRRFASPQAQKFAAGSWSDGLGGAPVLHGCAAVLQCERFAEHVAGDHVLFIGQVRRLFEAPLPPLVYRSGHYHLLGEIV